MSDLTNTLIEQVKEAASSARALRIEGADTKRFLGREIQGERLSLAEHRGIMSYQPVELVLTARAGTPLVEIKSALAEHNQVLSFDPPTFEGRATLGGTLAANLSGPSRPWSGSVRDMVLGVKLINGRGELLNFGGQVMKNVAGYDVSRAQAGAMGTLGVMTQISLKVMPKPEVTRSLVLDIAEGEAITLMNQLAATPKPIVAASWYKARLMVRLAGASSSVEQCAQCWIRDYGFTDFDNAQTYWRELRDYRSDFFSGDDPVWRFSLSSTAAPLQQGDTLIDWGGAQRWITGEAELASLQRVAEQGGGFVQCWRGGDRSAEVNPAPSHVMRTLQQRIKAAMDPHNIFNPGRLYRNF